MNSWINLFFVTLENFIYIISSSNKNQNYKISSLVKRKRTATDSNIINKFYSSFNDARNISTPKINNQTKFIEMNDLSESNDNYNNNINDNKNMIYFKEDEIKNEENRIEFDRCFDCNYFWINNKERNEQNIIKFIKDNTKFKGDDIENMNLNNIYEYFSKENKSIFNIEEKKIKFKIQGYGLDNYAKIKNLEPRFGVIVTYLLE